MATTVINGTLKVTITEQCYLNGRNQGGSQTLSISNVDEISRRIVTVPTGEIEIIKMDTSPAAATFIESDVRYIRITNLDNENHIYLTFKNEDTDEFVILLDYGQSFIYNSNLAGGVVNTFDAAAGAADINNLGDLVNITAQADTAACDVEIFVASV